MISRARASSQPQLISSVFERLNRYEMRLRRQTVQTILVLNAINYNADEYDFDGKRFKRSALDVGNQNDTPHNFF
jgi:hypothetical protein